MENQDISRKSATFISRRRPKFILGIPKEKWIEVFFFGNAWIAILILLMIAFFLFKEGATFFKLSQEDHTLYRRAGLEFVDQIKAAQEDFTSIDRYLSSIRIRQMELLQYSGDNYQEAARKCSELEEFSYGYLDLAIDLRELNSELTAYVTLARDNAVSNRHLHELKAQMETDGEFEAAQTLEWTEVDFRALEEYLRKQIPVFAQTAQKLINNIQSYTSDFPELPAGDPDGQVQRFRDLNNQFAQTIPTYLDRAKAWDPDEPIGFMKSFTSFVFGKQWITHSFWQDWYGFLPLLTGSLLVTAIALLIAVPFGVLSAIYVNQIASEKEQQILKPSIEFISAIPSVVLGFFGVAVLGEILRQVSNWTWLEFIPFFPISERLNALTAGSLLALMAIPTIFTLSEDAINRVPKTYLEASYAVGANRLQTIIKVILPTALSGIISAILLGFGRVIGETMVVLLCAGNRIAIPEFSEGIGVIVEPVHTMTGIIAQEMGEVERGSIHYRALFVLGMFLFFISLLVNWIAQKIVRQFKITV